MIRTSISAALAALLALSASSPFSASAQSIEIPAAPREFRAVWVATVSNVDWPSKPDLSIASQKAEAIKILDRAKELNMNAIIFQVRPACDALYQSSLEPWSQFLTGRQGRAPMPFYDPLQMWVEESHKRGLELHAWFNPYRASHSGMKDSLAANHISKTKPHLVKDLGKYLWLDPGEKEVQDHTTNVILDVVRRYDVDGVHFDDYFYPYKSYLTAVKDFPDDPSWQKYQAAGGTLSRPDWRRENVNILMRRVYESVKATKPHVKVGIAPFGIWKPGYPSGIVGMNAHEDLYTDSKKWLNEGWVDYFSPQLYWKISAEKQSYPKLLNWWAEQNLKGRHVWPGLAAHQVSPTRGRWPAEEIVNQILTARKVPRSGGTIIFSMKPVMRNVGNLATALEKQAFVGKALVPPSPWLDNQPPGPPAVGAAASPQQGQVTVRWQPTGTEQPFLWAVYAKVGNNWSFDVLPAGQTALSFPAAGSTAPSVVAISAIDRTGNESQRALAPVGVAARPVVGGAVRSATGG